MNPPSVAAIIYDVCTVGIRRVTHWLEPLDDAGEVTMPASDVRSAVLDELREQVQLWA